MLAQEAGLAALGADALDRERLPGERGESEGGAQDLPPAFAERPVDLGATQFDSIFVDSFNSLF